MKFWLRALPLTLGLFLSVFAVLAASDFIRSFYLDWDYPENVFSDNTDAWSSLVASFVCALIGFPLAIKGIERLTRQRDQAG